jgi:alkanesulfonate monooxygenase SsuD/methylene tetrahydromethanopterin reductase-like flavin-dependent oxidoreductase (luciferase family)
VAAAKRGIFLAPFDELVEPAALCALAQNADTRGWDGFFLWDHVAYRPPVKAVADPWVVLGAIAAVTRNLRIGTMVTPVVRRRVHKLARETVTLDRLSLGRLTLGVGLGSDRTGELERFGEVQDPRERARLLDERLEQLATYWSGEFEPPPFQRPRIPVWVAGRWPHRRPLRRAARWDGFFPIELPGPEALSQLAAELAALRSADAPFDLVVEVAPGEAVEPWADAGATWVLTGFGPQPHIRDVDRVIEAGPN